MDAQNRPEEKLQTFKGVQYKKEIASLKKPADPHFQNPPSTLKMDALMQKRRLELENKMYDEQMKAREEVERAYKQKRLTQRVKCSPALIDNQAVLVQQRESSLRRAREEMMVKEKTWDRSKAEIEYRVANRPLLVEQQSQQFRQNLQEMQEVENFVQTLREGQIDPYEHLNDRQKELLANAEYLDKLNAQTAYFPTNNLGIIPMEEEELEGEEESEMNHEGEGSEEEQEMPHPPVQEVPEHEEYDEQADIEVENIEGEHEGEHEGEYEGEYEEEYAEEFEEGQSPQAEY